MHERFLEDISFPFLNYPVWIIHTVVSGDYYLMLDTTA
jgi:hypothetical protein